MSATEPNHRPSDSPIPLASFKSGGLAFIFAFCALPFWASGYGAWIAISIDLAAMPLCFKAFVMGIAGLKFDNGGYAFAGLVLSLLAPLMTWLVLNSWTLANLFRF